MIDPVPIQVERVDSKKSAHGALYLIAGSKLIPQICRGCPANKSGVQAQINTDGDLAVFRCFGLDDPNGRILAARIGSAPQGIHPDHIRAVINGVPIDESDLKRTTPKMGDPSKFIPPRAGNRDPVEIGSPIAPCGFMISEF